MNSELLKSLEIITSAGLLVLILIVQILHYPFFKYIEENNFSKAMRFHQNRISSIVMPLMLVELALSVYAFYSSSPKSTLLILIVLLIWGSTFFIQVPLHQKLLLKKDDTLIKKLVRTNWIRTILWTIKFILVIC